MTRLVILFAAVWLSCFVALRLGARVLRWLVDRDTTRRDHAAYRRRVAWDQQRRYRREADLDEQSTDYMSRAMRRGDRQ